MFFSNKVLKEKNASLELENKELKAQAGSVESLQGDNDRLSEELATANTALEVAKVKISDAEKVATEAADVKAEAEKVIKEQPAKVAAAASSTVAALGVDPVAEVASADGVEGVQIDEYAVLNKKLEASGSATERGKIALEMLKIYENK